MNHPDVSGQFERRESLRMFANKAKRKLSSDKCTGCRACELVCSFHHTKTFDPTKSSIKVERDFLTGAINITLDSTCDECAAEGEPLCVKFCAPGALGAIFSELAERRA